jgi:AAA15 family ATPase/GTPase
VQFIRSIRIKDFRSLPAVALTDVDNITPIIGPNGSGKSSLLRALNLFFNGQVENGVPSDLGRDFHDPEGKRKQELHDFLRERDDASDIEALIHLVPWISKLVSADGQQNIAV